MAAGGVGDDVRVVLTVFVTACVAEVVAPVGGVGVGAKVVRWCAAAYRGWASRTRVSVAAQPCWAA